MNNTKLKKYKVFYSKNSHNDININEVLSHSTFLNNRFWHSLRESINMKMDCSLTKEKILFAKKLLTPIIQDLMDDVLDRIAQEKTENPREDRKVPYPFVKKEINNIWHVQKVTGKKESNNDMWAREILREMNTDLQESFETLHDKINENLLQQRSSLSQVLLKKLVAIHQHLGCIIKRLKEEHDISRDGISLEKSFNNGINIPQIPLSDNNAENKKYNLKGAIVDNHDDFCSDFENGILKASFKCLSEQSKLNNRHLNRDFNVFAYSGSFTERCKSESNLGKTSSLEHLKFEHSEKGLNTYESFISLPVETHVEEDLNAIEKKEIIHKCLQDLEKIRTYLEILRKDREFGKSEYCRLENCLQDKDSKYAESYNGSIYLKTNEHIAENEPETYVTNGNWNSTNTLVNFHILPNRQKDNINIQAEQKSAYKCAKPKRVVPISRIPKLIDIKKTIKGDMRQSNTMKITLGNKEKFQQNVLNLVIFDPKDPCKSVIKMKEQKTFKSTKSKPIVSIFLLKRIIQNRKTVKDLDNKKIFQRNLFWLRYSTLESIHYATVSICFVLTYLENYCALIIHWIMKLILMIANVHNKLELNANLCYSMNYKIIQTTNYLEDLLKFMRSMKSFGYSNIKMNLNYVVKCKYWTKQTNFIDLPSQYNNITISSSMNKSFNIIENFKLFSKKYEKNWLLQSHNTLNYSFKNFMIYPVWKIKKSKYYNLPTLKTEKVTSKKGKKKISQEAFKMTDGSVEPKNLLTGSISGNMCRIKSSSSGNKLAYTDSVKLSKKTDIKRKVSFREEVDFSASAEDQQYVEHELGVKADCQNENSVQHDKSCFRNKKSISKLKLEDTEILTDKNSDMILPDFQKKIFGEKSLTQAKSKQLKLNAHSNSVKDVLESTTESFINEKDSFQVLETPDGRLISQFYDEKRIPITEVFDFDGDLIGRVKPNDVNDLAFLLFDSKGKFRHDRYNCNGKRIRAVYDANDNKIREIEKPKLENSTKQIPDMQLYGRESKSIEQLCNSFSPNMETNDTNSIPSIVIISNTKFNSSLHTTTISDIPNDTNLERESVTQIKPKYTSKQEVDEPELITKFCDGNGDVTQARENNANEYLVPQRFFDQEGNPLKEVYDKKGNLIKVTSSGEADELAPYLFSRKGKLHRTIYDFKGREMKAVFDEGGEAISELSIPWLSNLLAAHSDYPKAKKNDSFSCGKSKYKTKLKDASKIKQLYNADGNILTGIYDSKGNPLIVSKSGDASKLLPHLFDNKGKLIKKRYDSVGRKMKCIYDCDKNSVTSISLTILNQFLPYIDKNKSNELAEISTVSVKQSDSKSIDKKNDNKSISSIHILNEASVSFLQINESLENTVMNGKAPNELFEKSRKATNDRLDSKSKTLEKSKSTNSCKMRPDLLELNRGILNRDYKYKDSIQNKSSEKNDNLIKKKSRTEMMKVGRAHKISENENRSKSNLQTQEQSEIKRNENSEISENTSKQLSFGSDLHQLKSICSEIIEDRYKALEYLVHDSSNLDVCNNSIKEMNYVKKQPSPISSTSNLDRGSILKAGKSIYKFYDGDGNIITKVYNSNGKILKANTGGDVNKLSPFLFDKEGFLLNDVYDYKGMKLINIYDQEGRSISRVSIPSELFVLKNDVHRKRNKKIPGSVYDRHGVLVKDIYDKFGNTLIKTKMGRLEDLYPIIFDEKGVKRKIYNKRGHLIESLFDYKGNSIQRLSPIKRPIRDDLEHRPSDLYTKNGRTIKNFYNSEGKIILEIFNNFGKSLYKLKNGESNVAGLSKILFNKHGRFLRGKIFDSDRRVIKHVYDSNENIIYSIKKTSLHNDNLKRTGDIGNGKSTNTTICMEEKQRNIGEMSSPKKHPGCFEQGEVKKNILPKSTLARSCSNSLLQQSVSVYSFKSTNNNMELNTSSSLPSMRIIQNSRFFDEHGNLLRGIYNSQGRLLGYSSSGCARVLYPYLFDSNGKFVNGRYNIHGKLLRNIFDSKGSKVEYTSKSIDETKTVEYTSKKRKKRKFYDVLGIPIKKIFDSNGKNLLSKEERCNELVEYFFDENGEFIKKFYDGRGKKIKKVYDEYHRIIRKISPLNYRCTRNDKEKVSLKDQKPFPISSSFKDKILTVIFDNQDGITKQSIEKIFEYRTGKMKKIGHQKSSKKENNCTTTVSKENVLAHSNNNNESTIDIKTKLRKAKLYDECGKMLKTIYDEEGKQITKVYTSKGSLVCKLNSPSDSIKGDSKSSKDSAFFRKIYDSAGTIIGKMFTNTSILKKMYDKSRNLAKVDSKLVHLVSKQSFSEKANRTGEQEAPKQINYFSEGKFSWFFSR